MLPCICTSNYCFRLYELSLTLVSTEKTGDVVLISSNLSIMRCLVDWLFNFQFGVKHFKHSETNSLKINHMTLVKYDQLNFGQSEQMRRSGNMDCMS